MSICSHWNPNKLLSKKESTEVLEEEYSPEEALGEFMEIYEEQ
ncbi:MAG: hypothetical protein ACLFQ8_03410 [Candidatus Aenigmatarchaeota archaeon]